MQVTAGPLCNRLVRQSIKQQGFAPVGASPLGGYIYRLGEICPLAWRGSRSSSRDIAQASSQDNAYQCRRFNKGRALRRGAAADRTAGPPQPVPHYQYSPPTIRRNRGLLRGLLRFARTRGWGAGWARPPGPPRERMMGKEGDIALSGFVFTSWSPRMVGLLLGPSESSLNPARIQGSEGGRLGRRGSGRDLDGDAELADRLSAMDELEGLCTGGRS